MFGLNKTNSLNNSIDKFKLKKSVSLYWRIMCDETSIQYSFSLINSVQKKVKMLRSNQIEWVKTKETSQI